jgi:hypothetical protein
VRALCSCVAKQQSYTSHTRVGHPATITQIAGAQQGMHRHLKCSKAVQAAYNPFRQCTVATLPHTHTLLVVLLIC